MSTDAGAAGLAALEREVARQQLVTAPAGRPWAHARPGRDHTVVVVGAGQAGLAVAHGLRRRGVADVLVVDAADEGSAGPWRSYARMHTLRTPTHVEWPDFGVPAANPQSWFRARYGDDAWESLERMPRSDWQAFLEWYRRVLRVPVRFGVSLTALAVAGDAVTLTFADDTVVTAERVVLATGLEGAGGRRVPDSIERALPRERWHHIHDDIDFAALAGARVGVLGGGTGAFDNAAVALEAGAASAHVHLRRAAMPTVSPYRWMEFPGILEHFCELDDAQRWAFNAHLAEVDQPATQQAVWRAFGFDAFRFVTGSVWRTVAWNGSEVVVTTDAAEYRYEHVLAATGVEVDLARRPELAGIHPDVLLWGDRPAAAGAPHAELGRYPYLDDRFGLVSRSGDAGLGRVHLFNHGARMSHGMLSHQVSGIRGGAERLVTGIVAGMTADRAPSLLADFLAYDVPAGVRLGRAPQGPDAEEAAA